MIKKLCVIFLFFFLFVSLIPINAKDSKIYGKIVKLMGTVEIQKDNRTDDAKIGDYIEENNAIHTLQNSAVDILFEDGSIIRLEENSQVLINKAVFEKTKPVFNLKLFVGSILNKIKKSKPTTDFVIETPVAVVSVRGTLFLVQHNEDTRTAVFEGKVFLRDRFGKNILVKKNYQAKVNKFGLQRSKKIEKKLKLYKKNNLPQFKKNIKKYKTQLNNMREKRLQNKNETLNKKIKSKTQHKKQMQKIKKIKK